MVYFFSFTDCPSKCNTGLERCTIDMACCSVFDLNGKCAEHCQANSSLNDSFECICDQNYIYVDDKCVRDSDCEFEEILIISRALDPKH